MITNLLIGLAIAVLVVVVLWALAVVVLLLAGSREHTDDVPDPVDEHFTGVPGGSFYVKSNHPEDCAGKCCWEIRLTEMVERFDWHAAEYEMRKTK